MTKINHLVKSDSVIKKKIEDVSHAISFEEENHLYFFEKDGQELSSVSSVLDYYSPSFNKISIASHVSSRDGIGVKEILSSWKIRRDFSAVKGSEFHLYASVYLLENRRLPVQTPINNQISAFHKFWRENKGTFRIIATEFCVYDEKYRLAGTVDCLAQKIGTEDYVIFDWKTNKNIRSKNSFYECLKEPLDHLDHCEHNRFSLQLSLYRFLIKKCLNLSVQKAFFVQFNENKEYYLCEASCFDEEVENVLKIRKDDLSSKKIS